MSVVANVAINVDSRSAVNNIRAVNAQAKTLQGSFNQLTAAAKGLQTAFAAIAITGVVGQTVRAAASFNDLQKRLRLLTSEYGEYSQAQAFAAKAAKQFGLSNREATAGVADIYARLRPLNISLKDIQSTFTGFNTIAKLSGVQAAGAAAAFTQLAQALGSGRLQGDEFRSIAEQIPGLLVAVSKETGIATKDLKQFASDGKLTSDIIINALKRVESEGAGKIEQLIKESDIQKFKDLENAVDDLSVAVGNELLPIVTPLIQDFTSLVRAVADLPDPVKSATAEIVKIIVQMVLLEKAIKAIIALRAGIVGTLASIGTTAATAAPRTTALGTAIKGAGVEAATATPLLTALRGVLLSLAKIGIITIGVNILIYGLQELQQAKSELDRLRGIQSRGGAAGMFPQGVTQEQRQAAQATLNAVRREQQQRAAANQRRAERGLSPERRDEILAERARLAQATLALPARQAAAPSAAAIAGGGITATGGGGRAGRGRSGVDQAARDAERAAEIARQQLKTADEQNFALKNQLAILQETEAVAKRKLELDVRLNEINREYAELRENAKTSDELILINANEIVAQRIAQLNAERELNEIYEDRARLMVELTRAAAMPTVYSELEQQDAALQAVLDKYPAIGAAADAAATLATSGIAEMIAGTKSAEQVFVDFLRSVADALINTAKQMIAQYIAIGIARMFAGLGGGGSGGMDFTPVNALPSAGLTSALPTSFAFAEGGFVTGPTRALIGEGGEPEYVIPASKMKAAMSRYSRGARGESVIPSTGGADGGMEAPAGGVAAIDVRYTVERINSVDYVTADQFQRGMQQAAAQGASQGEQRTLRRLQQSASTRRRVGV